MSPPQAPCTADDVRPEQDAPTSPLRMLAFALIALVCGGAAAQWLDMGGRRPISAYVQVRTTYVTAERAGRVERVLAPPGTRVTIGADLVEYRDTELEERLTVAERQAEVLAIELRQAEARANLEIAQTEQELEDRICQAKLQAAGYRQDQFESELRHNLLADMLASHQSALWDSGEPILKSVLLSQMWPSQERLQTVLQMESIANQTSLCSENVAICETRVQALQQLRAALPEQVRESCGVSVTRARLEQSNAEIERLREMQSGLKVVSPAVGQVGLYRSRPGDQLRPGDPIVELLDDSQRYLIAEVPSTRIHEFTLGRTVNLQFPGAERRLGRVCKVAPQARPRDPSRADDDPVVEVEIEQAGRLWPTVPIGTRISLLTDNIR